MPLHRLAPLFTLLVLITSCASVSLVEPAPEFPEPRPVVVVEPDPWDTLYSSLELKDQVGQLLMVEVRDPSDGRFLTSVSEEYREWARDIQPGGFILFAGNLENPEQTRRLIDELSALTTVPPFIALDEEGGRVSRLNAVPAMGATPIPPNGLIGQSGDLEQAAAAARTIAEELKELGFNLDFAPVADIHQPGSGGVIGDRSYGADPQLVARMAGAFALALEAEGIMAVAKHFPGHGAARGDSHTGNALLEADKETLKNRELIPFTELIAGGISGVMLGHITVPVLDASGRPASLSAPITEGVLRKNLNFDGLIFTDSLRMGAVTHVYRADRLPLLAFHGGADILLMPVNPRESRNLLLEAYDAGEISARRLNASLKRIVAAKRRFLRL